MLFLLKKVKSLSDCRAHHRNRSGVVELVGREPLIFARVENGVTKFSPKRQKTPKLNFFKHILDQKQQFSVGNLYSFGRGKLTFGGGYNFKTG
jgi:hypothetical protein